MDSNQAASEVGATGESAARDQPPELPPKPRKKLNLLTVLKSDELFINFMEYMESINSAEYLLFWMNAESYRSFFLSSFGDSLKAKKGGKKEEQRKKKLGSLTSLRKDSPEEEDGEEELEESQLEDMREDAINIFRYHFSETSRKKINLSDEIFADLRQKIFRARPTANW